MTWTYLSICWNQVMFISVPDTTLTMLKSGVIRAITPLWKLDALLIFSAIHHRGSDGGFLHGSEQHLRLIFHADVSVWDWGFHRYYHSKTSSWAKRTALSHKRTLLLCDWPLVPTLKRAMDYRMIHAHILPLATFTGLNVHVKLDTLLCSKQG